ncbi:MAG: rhomboid family intramembrane serine protease [Vicinamibacteria bacterium]|nr:rhomboid family intramembrane serine protease [Vicinamibacteria bacterium]
MAWRSGYRRDLVLFGAHIPFALAVLGGVIIAASILGALFEPILRSGCLAPGLALKGQLWRLVTWGLFATHPISLIFACLVLYWFGKGLASAWGPWRLIFFHLGLSAASGAITSLVSLVWPALTWTAYASPWPALSAMIIVWAELHPMRQILLYFVLPMRGRTLVYVTVGITLLYAIFEGWSFYLPEFFAQGIVLAYMGGFRRFWLRARLASLNRRASHLRAVERNDRPRWLH